jgi:hypothetical protein
MAGLLGLWPAARGRLGWPERQAAGHTALAGVLAHGVWLSCLLVALDLGVPAGIVALDGATALGEPLIAEIAQLFQTVGNEFPTDSNREWIRVNMEVFRSSHQNWQ